MIHEVTFEFLLIFTTSKTGLRGHLRPFCKNLKSNDWSKKTQLFSNQTSFWELWQVESYFALTCYWLYNTVSVAWDILDINMNRILAAVWFLLHFFQVQHSKLLLLELEHQKIYFAICVVTKIKFVFLKNLATLWLSR